MTDQKDPQGMRILQVEYKDFFKFKSFKLKLGKVNFIVGDNAAGKTSFLKGIKTLEGGTINPDEYIRKGADKSEVLIDLAALDGKKYLTRRAITPASGGKLLTVKNEEGNDIPESPQTFLNQLLGHNPFAFNPVSMIDKDAKDLRKDLVRAFPLHLTEEEIKTKLGIAPDRDIGLDELDLDLETEHALDVIAKLYKKFYSDRTRTNKEVTRIKGQVEELEKSVPESPGTSDYKTKHDVTAEIERLRGKKEEAITAESTYNHKNELYDKAEEDIEAIDDNIAEAEEEIKRLQQKITDWKADKETKQKELARLEKEMDMELPDKYEIQEEIDALQTIADQFDRVQSLQKKREEFEKAKRVSTLYTKLLNRLETDIPKQLSEQIQIPIEDLTITDDDVLIDGISINNRSDGERLVLAGKYLEAVVPKGNFICIDGIQRLSHKTQQKFTDWMQKSDYQFIITETLSEQWRCSKDNAILISLGGEDAPTCPVCGETMDRHLTGELQVIRDDEVVNDGDQGTLGF